MKPQGIGRENIQTLEPMGKIQMSKGKPIKLSTTHFVFLCQSFVSAGNWLRKLFPWDGKGMEVKFELGRPPILEKCVLAYWESKSPEIHSSPIFIHVGLSHTVEGG